MSATRTSPSIVAPLSQIPWFDTGKGLAILAIVYVHLCGFLRWKWDSNLQSGVDAFLVISGYGLTTSHSTDNFGQFLRRRLTRLLPSYWLVLAFVVVTNHFAFHIPVVWLDVGLHAFCLHLIGGEPFAFSLVSAFWFMGLIVPLYFVFYFLRKHLRGPDSVLWSIAFCAVMALTGWWLLHFATSWGRGVQIHTAGRLVSFATGCLLASISRTNPSETYRQIKSPLAVALLAIWGIAAVNADASGLIIYPVGGVAIICVAAGMNATSRLTILTGILAGIGTISYEIYLVHQYLLVELVPRWFLVLLRKWSYFSSTSGAALNFSASMFSIATTALIAWALHACMLSLRWRQALGRPLSGCFSIVLTTTVIGIALPAIVPIDPPDLFIRVDKISSTRYHLKEPIGYWGKREQADLLFLAHSQDGFVRLGVDHWGTPLSTSRWFKPSDMEGQILEIRHNTNGVTISARGKVVVASSHGSHALDAVFVLGRNDIGFTECLPNADSYFTLLKP